MSIKYKSTKKFERTQLQELFLSVKWDSAKYPARLKAAIENSDAVFSAWDGEMLVGLMNALSDGNLNVYFPYLLVRPQYQGTGIGRRLVALMMERYSTCVKKSLIAAGDRVGFYEKCGFMTGADSRPMFLNTR